MSFLLAPTKEGYLKRRAKFSCYNPWPNLYISLSCGILRSFSSKESKDKICERETQITQSKSDLHCYYMEVEKIEDSIDRKIPGILF